MTKAPQQRALNLTAEQSERLNALADGDWEKCFVVLGRETHPGDPKRWRLWVLPTTLNKANAAIRKLTT